MLQDPRDASEKQGVGGEVPRGGERVYENGDNSEFMGTFECE